MDLPLSVLSHILSFITWQELGVVASVSKEWYQASCEDSVLLPHVKSMSRRFQSRQINTHVLVSSELKRNLKWYYSETMNGWHRSTTRMHLLRTSPTIGETKRKIRKLRSRASVEDSVFSHWTIDFHDDYNLLVTLVDNTIRMYTVERCQSTQDGALCDNSGLLEGVFTGDSRIRITESHRLGTLPTDAISVTFLKAKWIHDPVLLCRHKSSLDISVWKYHSVEGWQESLDIDAYGELMLYVPDRKWLKDIYVRPMSILATCTATTTLGYEMCYLQSPLLQRGVRTRKTFQPQFIVTREDHIARNNGLYHTLAFRGEHGESCSRISFGHHLDNNRGFVINVSHKRLTSMQWVESNDYLLAVSYEKAGVELYDVRRSNRPVASHRRGIQQLTNYDAGYLLARDSKGSLYSWDTARPERMEVLYTAPQHIQSVLSLTRHHRLFHAPKSGLCFTEIEHGKKFAIYCV